ncbi:MAG: N-acetyltransferase [Candidatus Omnitrophica bacterium]|nr:N-acetyltransferase [Candidatus Omnitrophota bacterium]
MSIRVQPRKAVLKDAPVIRKLVNNFARDGRMLALSYNQIYERLRDFWVVEVNGKVVGCAALKIVWKDLGEVRSLAINRRFQKKGYASLLMESVLGEAKLFGLKKIFALTYIPEFFEKLGFLRIPKAKLPHKIWFDCINCPKFPRCDEVAVLKSLR